MNVLVILTLTIIWFADHIKYLLDIGNFLLLVYIELLYPLELIRCINIFIQELYLVNHKELFFHLSFIFFIVFSLSLKLYLFILYIFCKDILNSFLLYSSEESLLKTFIYVFIIIINYNSFYFFFFSINPLFCLECSLFELYFSNA